MLLLLLPLRVDHPDDLRHHIGVRDLSAVEVGAVRHCTVEVPLLSILHGGKRSFVLHLEGLRGGEPRS